MFLLCSLADVSAFTWAVAHQRTTNASSTYGRAAWHAPSCGLSGRWAVDKIRPDMLDKRALIPPLWAPHLAQNDARAGGGEGHSSRSVAGVPDIGQDELVRFFTLMPADVEFVASRRARDTAQGLGLAVQLCTLRLGFVPDEVRAAPLVAVVRLVVRLKVDPGVLAG